MRKKRHTPEEIVAKVRQVDALVAQGTRGRQSHRFCQGSRQQV